MKQQGFVLLLVLIIISVMSLIGIYTLRLGQSEQRIARQSLMAYQRELYHLSMLSRIEYRVMESLPPCVVDTQSTRQIAYQPASWWELNGCFEQALSLRYMYVVEDAGLDNCAVISNSDEIAHYYRISILAKQSNSSNGSIILQSTIIKGDKRLTVCQFAEHLVNTGRQGIRWIAHKGMSNDTANFT